MQYLSDGYFNEHVQILTIKLECLTRRTEVVVNITNSNTSNKNTGKSRTNRKKKINL